MWSSENNELKTKKRFFHSLRWIIERMNCRKSDRELIKAEKGVHYG